MAKRRGVIKSGQSFISSSRALKGSGGGGGAYLSAVPPTRYLVPDLIAPAAGRYSGLASITTGYSVEVRLVVSSAASAEGKILARGISVGGAAFDLWLDSGDIKYASGSGSSITTYSPSLVDNQTIDLVLAGNSTTAALYLDGSLVSTGPGSLSIASSNLELEDPDGTSAWIPPAQDVALTGASIVYPVKYYNNQLPAGFPA